MERNRGHRFLVRDITNVLFQFFSEGYGAAFCAAFFRNVREYRIPAFRSIAIIISQKTILLILLCSYELQFFQKKNGAIYKYHTFIYTLSYSKNRIRSKYSTPLLKEPLLSCFGTEKYIVEY